MGNSPLTKASLRSEELPELINRESAVAKYLVEKAWADRFARVDGDYCSAAVSVTEEVVAAACPDYGEAGAAKS
jgi:hypothetical protein